MRYGPLNMASMALMMLVDYFLFVHTSAHLAYSMRSFIAFFIFDVPIIMLMFSVSSHVVYDQDAKECRSMITEEWKRMINFWFKFHFFRTSVAWSLRLVMASASMFFKDFTIVPFYLLGWFGLKLGILWSLRLIYRGYQIEKE